MTFEYFEEHFTQQATKAGYTEENITKCLTYAKPLLNQNLPIIFNTANLSVLVGYKKSYLKKAVLYPTYFYRSFKVKKRNGDGFRYLKEPLPSLKEIQYWILENILYSVPVSRFSKAYIPNRTIIQNVKYHRNKDIVVNLDIENFFDSIKRPLIEKIFQILGYSSNISNLLGKLCCCNESIPQGAPTSPYLSNIFMKDFDLAISTHAKANETRYTRYADDLTFSGDHDKLNQNEVIELVAKELEKIGLRLNEKKTNIMTRNTRQIVTGIVVNSVIQIPKKKRDKIRQEVFYIRTYGLPNHLEKTNNKKSNYLEHLLGKINFALYINPSDNEMKEYYNYIKSLIYPEEL